MTTSLVYGIPQRCGVSSENMPWHTLQLRVYARFSYLIRFTLSCTYLIEYSIHKNYMPGSGECQGQGRIVLNESRRYEDAPYAP